MENIERTTFEDGARYQQMIIAMHSCKDSLYKAYVNRDISKAEACLISMKMTIIEFNKIKKKYAKFPSIRNAYRKNIEELKESIIVPQYKRKLTLFLKAMK